MEYGHDRLACLLGRDALDRERDDLPGPLLSFFLCLVLDVPDHERCLALGLLLDRRHQLGLGLLGHQPRHALKFCLALDVELVELSLPLIELPAHRVHVASQLSHPAGLIVKPLLALGNPRLTALQIGTQLPDLRRDGTHFFVKVAARFGRAFRRLLGSPDDRSGLGLCRFKRRRTATRHLGLRWLLSGVQLLSVAVTPKNPRNLAESRIRALSRHRSASLAQSSRHANREHHCRGSC